MAGAVIPVGVPLSPRNIYLRDPVFSITQTASRFMRTTIVAACISGRLLFISGGLRAQQRPAVSSLETLLGFDETEYLALFLGLAIAGADRISLDYVLQALLGRWRYESEIGARRSMANRAPART
jgi:hypothetical protein